MALPPKKPNSDPPDEADTSPYAPRSAAEVPEQSVLPPAKDVGELQRATADMIEFGIPLDDAAARYGVDADTLHVYYRTYVKTFGKENLETRGEFGEGATEDFDRLSRRQFDRNWAEMTFQAERARPQASALRKWLMAFPLTGWAFNGDRVESLAVIGALCVLALGGVAFLLTRRDVEAPPSVLVREEPTKVDMELMLSGTKLTDGQKEDYFIEVAKVIKNYMELETWQERLPLVRRVDGVEEKMRDYYEKHPDGASAAIELEPKFFILTRSDGRFEMTNGRRANGKGVIFMLESLANGSEYLIDWETLVNYEPVVWEDFCEAKGTEPAPFRVKISEGDYYNFPFMDEGKFMSFRLSLLYRDEMEVFGYARRGSDVGEAILAEIQKDPSRRQAMVLNLRFPEGAKLDEVVEIESIVQNHW